MQRRAQRERLGLFVAEGEDLLEADAAARWPAQEWLCAAGNGLLGREVAQTLLAEISSLGSGTRALGVFAQHCVAPHGRLCVYLHGVGDTGNVGTVLRGAPRWPSSPHASRSVPATPTPTAQGGAGRHGRDLRRRRRAGAPEQSPGSWIALDPHAGELLRGPAPLREVTLLVGAERAGLPASLLERSAVVAGIPIAAESLNAAMAATVALYELTRARSTRPRAKAEPMVARTPPFDDPTRLRS